jgi:hypothetical protein
MGPRFGGRRAWSQSLDEGRERHVAEAPAGRQQDAAIRMDDGLAAFPRHGMIGETEPWANR